ncbi:MAG: MAPEG family protein [Sphingopyxis sp.]
MTLTITLIFAACAALVNLWLAIRISKLRTTEKISHGDGGHGLLGRRMRAQLNFAENTPVVLILVAALELSGTPALWLWILAVAYILGRIVHALGMDPEEQNWMRGAGISASMLVTLLLVGLALLAGYGHLSAPAMQNGTVIPV